MTFISMVIGYDVVGQNYSTGDHIDDSTMMLLGLCRPSAFILLIGASLLLGDLPCYHSVDRRDQRDEPETFTFDDNEDTNRRSHRNQNGAGVHDDEAGYYIGTGIYDMTGPAAQINFMGYAKATQTAHGIHQRLRARAFIVSEASTSLFNDNHEEEEEDDVDQMVKIQHDWEATQRRDEQEKQGGGFRRWAPSRLFRNPRDYGHLEDTHQEAPKSTRHHLDPDKTICFVSIDTGMGSDLLNMLVLKRLDELLPEQQLPKKTHKRLCHLENLSISGTHTHSSPGGFLQYALYQITSMGFSNEVMETYVEGIAQAILRAYNHLENGTIQMAKETFLGEEHVANINRSPTSYLLNPQWERDIYAEEGDTDKTMLQLKFSTRGKAEGTEGAFMSSKLIGILNWFAVHGTSMNSTNQLISGDNKGYASYCMEKYVNGQETLPGQGDFVAAFASTNLGDVSPNTGGPRCLDTGEPCDLATSTCNGRNAKCIASGPGNDMEESTEIIGRMQVDMATKLLQHGNGGAYLNGSVAFRHSFVDMSNRNVTLESGKVVHTCPAALGYGFAAGTTDGPGSFDFTQGENISSPFWNLIGGFLSPPTRKQKECHDPKPILLNTGGVTLPYPWDPDSVPISIFQIGRLFIVSVPCEFTTMAGRRLRRAVKKIAVDKGISNPEVTIAGLANSYTHYVTTFEEYAGQRYEAASTLYGPHTLLAYIQEFKRLMHDLLDGRPSTTDDAPVNLSQKQISLIPPVIFDTIGFGRKFGSVAIDSKDSYARGEDTVFVSFRSANPRNNQRIEGTFLAVDHLLDDGSWKTLYVDGDWVTKFVWNSDIDALGFSFAEIYWTIPPEAKQGIYRICHFGTRRTLIGDFEWLGYHTPDWWSFDMFGSIAAGILAQIVRLLARVSDSFAMALNSWEVGHLKDFQGCSHSFLVKAT